jgi:hypothetical protein
MTVIETVQYRTPLAVAFHDLVTDAPITDGLVVSARRAGIGGRFRVGYPTPSGVHVLSGLPFLRDAELPLDGPGERAESEDTPSSQTAEVDVLVEDRLGRFLPTVLRLSAPRDRVATAADVLSACSSLVWSVPAETPMFLMSGPGRGLPRTTAVVRACLRHHATGAPAAHAVLVVETPAGRTVGVADMTGNVVAALPYPDFAVPGTPGSIPAGSHGIPTVEQQWPVTVDVRCQPSALTFPAGINVPHVHSVFCQRAGAVFTEDHAPGQSTLAGTLRYGVELQLMTAGVTDPLRASYLFVESAP